MIGSMSYVLIWVTDKIWYNPPSRPYRSSSGGTLDKPSSQYRFGYRFGCGTVFQWWQPDNPLNTTLVIPNLVRLFISVMHLTVPSCDITALSASIFFWDSRLSAACYTCTGLSILTKDVWSRVRTRQIRQFRCPKSYRRKKKWMFLFTQSLLLFPPKKNLEK